jgi:hypothetical protein
MSHPEPHYLQNCPVGCNAPLEITAHVLPEGALLRCSVCGQLISQCSEAHYRHSMQEFDDPQGTLPQAGSERRYLQRSKKFLDRIATLLGLSAGQIRLLDVGCSSGTGAASGGGRTGGRFERAPGHAARSGLCRRPI